MDLKPLFVALLSVAFLSRPSVAQHTSTIPRNMNERVEMITTGSGFSGRDLETTLYAPPGTGPFPLVIINHGKAFGNPRFDPRARYPVVTREFIRRGYLVAIPMRAGYSKSSGSLIDSGCNSESNARLQAQDISAALMKLLERPEVDKSRVLLIGQSYGGMASIAVGTSHPPGVKGIINFAGGIRRSETTCNWQKGMIDAFAAFGNESKLPTLWFYGDNDSFWGAELPKSAHAAYVAAGGKAKLVSFGVFSEGDAHGMISSEKGVSIWWPQTEAFLNEIGMPSHVSFAIESTPRPPKTNFAQLSDDSAVPHLNSHRREIYRKFLSLPHPRAFAISKSGNVGWAFGGSDPLDRALFHCESHANTACTLYAVDDDVVWKPSVKH